MNEFDASGDFTRQSFPWHKEHKCESSSVVELHLAKVDVAGPNPVFRFET